MLIGRWKHQKTPKRKYCKSTSPVSLQESSPADKRLKKYCPHHLREEHAEEEFMPDNANTENLSEGLLGKIDLILTQLNRLDLLERKIDEVTTAMQGLQNSVVVLEKDVASVKVKF